MASKAKKGPGGLGQKPPGTQTGGPGNSLIGQNNQGQGNKKGMNNKNKKPMKDEVKKALSYNKNTPMMIMVGIFLFFIMYNLLKHMRNKDAILKHKINTEIRRKLYFKDEYDGE
jgi:hypothetical protein